MFDPTDTLPNGDHLHDDLRVFNWSSQTGSGVQYCRTYSRRRLSSVCGVAVRSLTVDAVFDTADTLRRRPNVWGTLCSIPRIRSQTVATSSNEPSQECKLCSIPRTRFVDGLTFEVRCVRFHGHALRQWPLLLQVKSSTSDCINTPAAPTQTEQEPTSAKLFCLL